MVEQGRARTVIITGAAGGIGGACVTRFSGAGWRVFALDVRRPEDQPPAAVAFFQVDIAEASAVESFCQGVARELTSGLDALVNNAAIQITKPLSATSIEEWDSVHTVNLRAPFLFAKYLYPSLKQARGAVVNVSSVHAFATSANIGAYASSKGGLLALTRAMANEFSKDGVRVNALLPGATDTQMLANGFLRSGDASDNMRGALASKILLKRLAIPDEIARAIYFLADNDQSSYITGQSLVVDGGALAHLSTE
jgi:NAD(P)-dependent dehydrogenase (short-subunit alcohol dehydrogenase family)